MVKDAFDVSLYFHLPFCKRKCDYCHFYVIPDNALFKKKLSASLRIEWDRRAPELQDRQISSIYFGGGTPTLFGPDLIHDILARIGKGPPRSHCDREITLEANPEDVTLALMQSYAQAGINRVSIGIQSLDPQLLTLLSRRHSVKQAKEAVMLTHKAGFNNISVDLMYDLPEQTLSSWKKTLSDVKPLPITHLSLYNLVIEPHTVFHKKKKTLASQLPDPSTSVEMYTHAIETLNSVGFIHYEISAFQRNNSYSRHNAGYWTGRPFLGFGPSAFSYWKGKRSRNIAHLGRYHSLLTAGKSPIDFEEELPEPSKRRELLAIHLRLLQGVEIEIFEGRHGPLDEETKTTIKQLEEDGLLEQIDKHLRLTKKGILFYDTVASEII
ncbi:MAG: radical SAM family heme chaperone HemW [Waddliaceae bacterium]